MVAFLRLKHLAVHSCRQLTSVGSHSYAQTRVADVVGAISLVEINYGSTFGTEKAGQSGAIFKSTTELKIEVSSHGTLLKSRLDKALGMRSKCRKWKAEGGL